MTEGSLFPSSGHAGPIEKPDVPQPILLKTVKLFTNSPGFQQAWYMLGTCRYL